MANVEMHTPWISNELAKSFEELKKDNLSPSDLCNSIYYVDEIPEKNLGVDYFEKLLIKMSLLGYEVKKPKSKYIRLNSNKLGIMNYLNLDNYGSCFLSDRYNHGDYRTEFTQKEVDGLLRCEPKGMWVVEEVEDQ